MEIPGTCSWGNWQFRSASLRGPTRDATASTCRVSNTAPHHSAAQALPPSQSRPTESLSPAEAQEKGQVRPLFPHHLTHPHLVKPSGSPPGRVPCLRIRLRRIHAAGTEYHCIGQYVSFIEEAMGLQVNLQLLHHHHHQRQCHASLMQVRP